VTKGVKVTQVTPRELQKVGKGTVEMMSLRTTAENYWGRCRRELASF